MFLVFSCGHVILVYLVKIFPQTLDVFLGNVLNPKANSVLYCFFVVTHYVRKILFVELLGGIGDVLSALPAIQAVSRTSPPPDERVGDRFRQILLAEGLIEANAISPGALPLLHLTPAEASRAQEALRLARRPLVFLCPDAAAVGG